MKNKIVGELTSALLDGELDRSTQQAAIWANLAADDEERQRFARYRLIGDVMRGESAVLALQVSSRVREALRVEPAILAPPRRARHWLRPAAGLAVAASVATLAVVLAPQLLTSSGEIAQPMQLAETSPEQATLRPALVASTAPADGQPPRAAGSGVRWQALDTDLEERLNRLVIEHHEFGGRTGIHGPVPHIGFANYGDR
ncbi:MAG: RseA family anti-sigma factor [Sedimenticolaceae bacterium]